LGLDRAISVDWILSWSEGKIGSNIVLDINFLKKKNYGHDIFIIDSFCKTWWITIKKIIWVLYYLF
jgi:hypothetical protein